MEINKKPIIIDGIISYAPELAYSDKDYNESSFKRLFELEAGNFNYIMKFKNNRGGHYGKTCAF